MSKDDFSRSPKVLFERYLADFETIGIDWNEGWKKWTGKNLGYFAKLGEDHGYRAYGKGAQGKPEYLVDLCWRVEEDRHCWIELALEEEWDRKWDNIKPEFFKLMDVKAYLKVLVCFPEEAIRSHLPSWLAQEVSAHAIKIPEEAYLLIIFSRDARRKQSERLQIEGYGIDYRGNFTLLDHKCFPDSLLTGA